MIIQCYQIQTAVGDSQVGFNAALQVGLLGGRFLVKMQEQGRVTNYRLGGYG